MSLTRASFCLLELVGAATIKMGQILYSVLNRNGGVIIGRRWSYFEGDIPMAEDRVLSSKAMLWSTTLIIPVLGILLSVYEIFYSDRNNHNGHDQLANAAEKLYHQGQKLERDGKILLAYQKYQEVQQRYGKREAVQSTVAAANSAIEQLRNSLRQKLHSMATMASSEQLQHQKKLAAILLPQEEMRWLDQQIAAKKKTEREEQSRWAGELEKAQQLCRNRNFSAAIAIYEKLLKQLQAPGLKHSVKQQCAQVYLLQADDLYTKSKLTGTLEHFSLAISTQLEKCRQLDEQGRYRRQVQALLKKLRSQN